MTITADQSEPGAPALAAGRTPDPSTPEASAQPPGPDAAMGTSPTHVLARNISWLTVGQVTTWMMTLVWTVVVPRRLGSSEMGIFTLSMAVGGVLMVIISLGMEPLLVRRMATDPEQAPRLIGTAIALRALLLVPALVVTVLLAWLGPFHGEEGAAVLLGWAACVAPGVILGPVNSGFRAIEKMRYLTYSSVLSKALYTVSCIVMVVLGIRAIGILSAAVLTGFLVTALTLLWARPHFRIQWRVSRHDLTALFVDSLPYWSFAAFFTIYLWIDSVMLAVMTSSTVVGWYGLPTQLFGTLMSVPVILSTAWLTRLVQAHRGGTAGLLRTARPAIEMVVVISMPVCVGTVLVASRLVQALYGSGFAQSAPVLILLALCVPPMYLNVVACQLMVAQDKQMVWTKMMVLASLINPLLNLVLIRYFQQTAGNGAIGASIAMVITEVILAGIGIWLIRNAFTRQMGVRMLRGAAATAGMAGLVVLALRAGLLPGIVTGVVSFPLLTLLFRVLSDDERVYLGALLRRTFGRGPAAEETG
ncbi:MAG: flippase [Candidatus Dormibacteria bacterium]|jgi:O-antigen/teichoic acid export membrane protein